MRGTDASIGVRFIRDVQAVLWNTQARAMLRSPVFWSAVVLKMTLGSLAASYFMRDLFVPFVNYFVTSGFSDPWSHFAALGRLNSFPYPPLMLYRLAVPRLLFSPVLAGGVDTVTPAHLFVMRLPLLVADFSIAIVLLRWFPGRLREVLLYYWWSPVAIYLCYWHGQLDVIPTAIFFWSLYLLRARRYMTGMALFGLALATKSHLL